MHSAILQFLAGTWFICSTSFPMWTSGKKTGPQFHYTVTEKRGRQVLYDDVTYEKNGRTRHIRGYDFPDEKDSTAFTWRGKGLLRLAKSRWRVALRDPNGQWAVICFSKTLFTPAGADIVFRTQQPDPSVLAAIKRQMAADRELRKHLPDMIDL